MKTRIERAVELFALCGWGSRLKMGDEIEVMGFSRIYIREARRSATRAAEAAAAGLHDEEAGATAAAILLAAASTEALVSELATVLPLTDNERQRIRDDRKPSIKERYVRLADVLQGNSKRSTISGAALRERREYKALHCLTQLRNAVAHRKAAFLKTGEWPRELEQCQNLIPYQRFGTHHWTHVLFVHTVAEWSWRSAEGWLKLWKGDLGL